MQSEPSNKYEYRRRLSAIIGEAELLNHELKGPVTEEQEEALKTIITESYELSGMLSARQEDSERLQRLKEGQEEEATVLIISASSFFDPVAEGQENLGEVDVGIVDSFDEAVEKVKTESYDRIIVDIILDDELSLGRVMDLIDVSDEPLKFGLISILSSPTGEPRLGISGMVSSEITEDELARALEDFLPESLSLDHAVIGTLGSIDSVIERLDAIDVNHISLAGEEVGQSDIVLADASTVVGLTKQEFARLRGFYQKSSRPMIVVDSSSEPFRSVGWVPTIGYDRYIYRPPSSVGVIGEILLFQPERPWVIDSQELSR